LILSNCDVLRFRNPISVLSNFFLFEVLFFLLESAEGRLGSVYLSTFGLAIDKNIACGNELGWHLLKFWNPAFREFVANIFVD
jgi:hypothetical protein